MRRLKEAARRPMRIAAKLMIEESEMAARKQPYVGMAAASRWQAASRAGIGHVGLLTLSERSERGGICMWHAEAEILRLAPRRPESTCGNHLRNAYRRAESNGGMKA